MANRIDRSHCAIIALSGRERVSRDQNAVLTGPDERLFRCDDDCEQFMIAQPVRC